MCFCVLYMKVRKYEKTAKTKPKPEKRAREMESGQEPEPGMLIMIKEAQEVINDP